MRTSALKGCNAMSGQAMSRGYGGSVLAAMLLVGVVALRPAPARAQDIKPETLDYVKRATVMVFNAASKSSKGDTPLGSGSGYFINSTGLLITNNHVVDPGHGRSPQEKWRLLNELNLLVQTIITGSGTEDEAEWECDLLYSNEKADQALLQALDEDGERLETPNYLRFMPESRLKERIKLVALGFPGGDSRKGPTGDHPEVNVVEGHVVDLPRTPAGRVRRIYTDAEVRAGNSGGPMVNLDGLLVGTLTLGIGNEERRNFNALVPAALTRDFIKAAFDLGKIPAGGDLMPFVEMLTQEDGRLNLPEFDRRASNDILFLPNDDRIYGNVATDKLTWDSPVGILEVPTDAIAYIITTDEGAHLFLEGGNRLDASEAASMFEFTPLGGTRAEYPFGDMHVVAFKTKDRRIEPLRGTTRTLDSDACRLILSDVKGQANFQTQLGSIKVGFDAIMRIERREDDDQQVLFTADGRRMTGQFDDTPFEGVIAATGMPIRFKLGEIDFAMVDEVNNDLTNVRGLNLLGVLAGAERKIFKVAEIVESQDPSGAGSKIETLLSRDELKRLTKVEKDQVQLLAGVFAIRSEDYQAATSSLRKVSKSSDANISAYAKACLEVLKRFPDHKYNGKSISDRMIFAQAGLELADKIIENVRDAISEAEHYDGSTKGAYPKGMSLVRKHEKLLPVASILGGEAADDEMIRLWKGAVALCQLELRRLDELEREEKDKDRGEGGRGRSRRGSSSRGLSTSPLQRALDDIQEQREKVMETFFDYRTKLGQYGFRIEDPDLQDIKEQEPDEENGP
jgi:S1-C subfamily serine protease